MKHGVISKNTGTDNTGTDSLLAHTKVKSKGVCPQVIHRVGGRDTKKVSVPIVRKIIAVAVTFMFLSTQVVQAGQTVYTIQIPEDHGKVSQRWKGEDERIIIHIQDAHSNLDAQVNLARIICELIPQISEQENPFIGIEGAIGGYDLKELRDFPIKEARDIVGRNFVKDGKFIGAEYASVISDRDFTLYGLEDKGLLMQDYNAFYHVSEKQDDIEKAIAEIEQQIEELKEMIYGGPLKKFDADASAYEKRDMDILPFVQILYPALDELGIDLMRYVSLMQFKEIVLLEQAIDRDELQGEIERLVEQVAIGSRVKGQGARNPERGTQNPELSQLYTDYKAGTVAEREMVFTLMNIAISRDINLLLFPNIDKLAQYYRRFALIDFNVLMREILKANNEIRNKLATTKDENLLIDLWRIVVILKQLVSLKVIREDVSEFRREKMKYSLPFIYKGMEVLAQRKGLALDLTEPQIDFDAVLALADEFYSLAEERNEAMLANLLSEMDRTQQNVGVLVAGGFHSDGIVDMLKQRNISYLTIQPRIDELGENVAYMDRMMGAGMPQMTGGSETFAMSRLNVAYQAFGRIDEVKTEGYAALQDLMYMDAQGNYLPPDVIERNAALIEENDPEESMKYLILAMTLRAIAERQQEVNEEFINTVKDSIREAMMNREAARAVFQELERQSWLDHFFELQKEILFPLEQSEKQESKSNELLRQEQVSLDKWNMQEEKVDFINRQIEGWDKIKDKASSDGFDLNEELGKDKELGKLFEDEWNAMKAEGRIKELQKAIADKESLKTYAQNKIDAWQAVIKQYSKDDTQKEGNDGDEGVIGKIGGTKNSTPEGVTITAARETTNSLNSGNTISGQAPTFTTFEAPQGQVPNTGEIPMSSATYTPAQAQIAADHVVNTILPSAAQPGQVTIGEVQALSDGSGYRVPVTLTAPTGIPGATVTQLHYEIYDGGVAALYGVDHNGVHINLDLLAVHGQMQTALGENATFGNIALTAHGLVIDINAGANTYHYGLPLQNGMADPSSATLFQGHFNGIALDASSGINVGLLTSAINTVHGLFEGSSVYPSGFQTGLGVNGNGYSIPVMINNVPFNLNFTAAAGQTFNANTAFLNAQGVNAATAGINVQNIQSAIQHMNSVINSGAQQGALQVTATGISMPAIITAQGGYALSFVITSGANAANSVVSGITTGVMQYHGASQAAQFNNANAYVNGSSASSVFSNLNTTALAQGMNTINTAVSMAHGQGSAAQVRSAITAVGENGSFMLVSNDGISAVEHSLSFNAGTADASGSYSVSASLLQMFAQGNAQTASLLGTLSNIFGQAAIAQATFTVGDIALLAQGPGSITGISINNTTFGVNVVDGTATLQGMNAADLYAALGYDPLGSTVDAGLADTLSLIMRLTGDNESGNAVTVALGGDTYNVAFEGGLIALEKISSLSEGARQLSEQQLKDIASNTLGGRYFVDQSGRIHLNIDTYFEDQRSQKDRSLRDTFGADGLSIVGYLVERALNNFGDAEIDRIRIVDDKDLSQSEKGSIMISADAIQRFLDDASSEQISDLLAGSQGMNVYFTDKTTVMGDSRLEQEINNEVGAQSDTRARLLAEELGAGLAQELEGKKIYLTLDDEGRQAMMDKFKEEIEKNMFINPNKVLSKDAEGKIAIDEKALMYIFGSIMNKFFYETMEKRLNGDNAEEAFTGSLKEAWRTWKNMVDVFGLDENNETVKLIGTMIQEAVKALAGTEGKEITSETAKWDTIKKVYNMIMALLNGDYSMLDAFRKMLDDGPEGLEQTKEAFRKWYRECVAELERLKAQGLEITEQLYIIGDEQPVEVFNNITTICSAVDNENKKNNIKTTVRAVRASEYVAPSEKDETVATIYVGTADSIDDLLKKFSDSPEQRDNIKKMRNIMIDVNSIVNDDETSMEFKLYMIEPLVWMREAMRRYAVIRTLKEQIKASEAHKAELQKKIDEEKIFNIDGGFFTGVRFCMEMRHAAIQRRINMIKLADLVRTAA
ncbi:MAG: hypothetical protein JW938_06895 [Candidatus Omnitrophica bacterium]|nr:hypothetical protein [Candidatus Omnitrophota bacterium]